MPQHNRRQPVRLRGAVRLMNRARDMLKTGIPPDQHDAFRDMIREGIQSIEAYCKQYRGKPENLLPTPTFRAYQFLKSIDLNNLPLEQPASSLPYAAPKISGIVSRCNRYHQEFTRVLPDWRKARTESSRETILTPLCSRLNANVDAITSLCAETGALPADLPKPSKHAYQWMAFLSKTENLAAHLDTLRKMYDIIEHERLSPPPRYAQGAKQTVFRLYQSTALYRGKKQGLVYDVLAHEGFITAPDTVLQALVHIIMGVSTAPGQRLYKSFINSDTFTDISIALELTAPPAPRNAQGIVYNLSEVFARMNDVYFKGKFSQPRLSWSEVHSVSKMGHYDPRTDTILISLNLDDKNVPQFYVDFVMYHELLHKDLGVKLVNGQRQAHTPQFRRLEKQFQQYDQVQDWLKKRAKPHR